MNLIERIDEARVRWNVLDHPFYRRWERGELSSAELAFYAGEYRHAVVALADAASASGDPAHAAEEDLPVSAHQLRPMWRCGKTLPRPWTRRLTGRRRRKPASVQRHGVATIRSRRERCSMPSSRASPTSPGRS